MKKLINNGKIFNKIYKIDKKKWFKLKKIILLKILISFIGKII